MEIPDIARVLLWCVYDMYMVCSIFILGMCIIISEMRKLDMAPIKQGGVASWQTRRKHSTPLLYTSLTSNCGRQCKHESVLWSTDIHPSHVVAGIKSIFSFHLTAFQLSLPYPVCLCPSCFMVVVYDRKHGCFR